MEWWELLAAEAQAASLRDGLPAMGPGVIYVRTVPPVAEPFEPVACHECRAPLPWPQWHLCRACLAQFQWWSNT